jgi:hypothetical protein
MSVAAGAWNPLQWTLIATAAMVTTKNYIINGAMMVSQQWGSTVLNAGATINFPVDMVFTNASSAAGGVSSVAQVVSLTPGGSPNRIRWTVTTASASVAAGDFLQFLYRIEGLVIVDLKAGTPAAKQVTLQFGVKGPVGTYSVAFSGGSGLNRSYVGSFTIASGEANSDTIKSITLTLDPTGTWTTYTSGIGLQLAFSLVAGTSRQTTTPNVWLDGTPYAVSNQTNFLGTVGNVFELFDIGLYQGTAAPTFQVPDYAQELMRCMRYYEQSVIDTCAVKVTGEYDANIRMYQLQFKVIKRAAPTVVSVNGTLTVVTSRVRVDSAMITSPSSNSDTITINARL